MAKQKVSVDVYEPPLVQQLEQARSRMLEFRAFEADARKQVDGIERKMMDRVFGDIDTWDPQQLKPKTFSMWACRDGYGYHWSSECPEGDWGTGSQSFYRDNGTAVMRAMGLPVCVKLKMYERCRVWFIPHKRGVRVKITDRRVIGRERKDKQGHLVVDYIDEIGQAHKLD